MAGLRRSRRNLRHPVDLCINFRRFVHRNWLICAWEFAMLIQEGESEVKYFPRWLESRITDVLRSHPVAVLTGPRQVGKSTLLERAESLKEWKYITLDDVDALAQAVEDPKGLFWEDKPTIVDEVQRCPELLLAIKYIVDKSNRRRRFILSGSGNISLRKSPRETLAGRAKYLHLTGFAYREERGLGPDGILDTLWKGGGIRSKDVKPPADIQKLVWRGSLPGIVLARDDNIALERLSGYIDTYLQRDIQDLVNIRHPQNFRLLMGSLSKATGWESVQEELSKTCGESRSNVSRYMSLLKDTNLLYELKGYAAKNEKAYRQSKYYWFDSGSACFLAGINSPSGLKNPGVRGRYFENYILHQILSWGALQIIQPEIFYWKPKNSEGEVDFVLLSAGRVLGVEVKSSSRLGFRDTKSMRAFMKSHPEAEKGIIVYTGKSVYPVASDIYAVPWNVL